MVSLVIRDHRTDPVLSHMRTHLSVWLAFMNPPDYLSANLGMDGLICVRTPILRWSEFPALTDVPLAYRVHDLLLCYDAFMLIFSPHRIKKSKKLPARRPWEKVHEEWVVSATTRVPKHWHIFVDARWVDSTKEIVALCHTMNRIREKEGESKDNSQARRTCSYVLLFDYEQQRPGKSRLHRRGHFIIDPLNIFNGVHVRAFRFEVIDRTRFLFHNYAIIMVLEINRTRGTARAVLLADVLTVPAASELISDVYKYKSPDTPERPKFYRDLTQIFTCLDADIEASNQPLRRYLPYARCDEFFVLPDFLFRDENQVVVVSRSGIEFLFDFFDGENRTD